MSYECTYWARERPKTRGFYSYPTVIKAHYFLSSLSQRILLKIIHFQLSRLIADIVHNTHAWDFYKIKIHLDTLTIIKETNHESPLSIAFWWHQSTGIDSFEKKNDSFLVRLSFPIFTVRARVPSSLLIHIFSIEI